MSFQHIAGVGMVHFQDVKPRRVVPGALRHLWDGKPGWGERTTCTKCGCVKWRKKPEYQEFYILKGTTQLLTERPDCSPSPAQ